MSRSLAQESPWRTRGEVACGCAAGYGAGGRFLRQQRCDVPSVPGWGALGYELPRSHLLGCIG